MDKIELLQNEPPKASPLLLGLTHPKYHPLTMVTMVQPDRPRCCSLNRIFLVLNLSVFSLLLIVLTFVTVPQETEMIRNSPPFAIYKEVDVNTELPLMLDHRLNLGLIVNGDEVPEDEAKFQVQIRQIGPNVDSFCGGTLIGSRYVLTAAHCFNPQYPVSTVSIRYGTHLSGSSEYQDVKVLKATRHPFYEQKYSHNDIAILKLAEQIRPGLDVEYAELDYGKLPAEQTVQLYGFGIENGTSTEISTVLKKASLKTLTVRECNRILRSANYPNDQRVICAHSPKQISCSGDSGGGLFNTQGRLVGVTSLVESGCRPGGVAIFTRISTHYYFIKMNTKLNF